MPSLSRFLRGCGLMAGGVTLACSSAFATSYTYQTIVQPGAIQTNPLGLNASGEVVGYWLDSNYGSHPFIYQNGTITSFSFPQGVDGISVAGINNKGDICGSYADSSDTTHGFIYTAKGKLITIDVPNGQDTFVNAINDKDEATGSAYVNGYGAAFAYSKGTYTVFTPATQYELFTPQAINSHGSVTGYESSYITGAESGFTYINGVFTVLSLPNSYFSAGFAINNHNVVAGQLANLSRQEFGFTYNAKDKETIIGPAGSTDTFSLGINNAGVVTGVNYDSSGVSTGYTYVNGVYSTLSFGGYTNFSGNYINESGQVLGEYVDQNGLPQSFLATPAQ
jgi:hypothetical protein